MAIAFVQSKSTKGVAVGSVSCTFNTTPTAGNAIMVAVTGWANAAAAGNVTDNKSNSYTIRRSPDGTNVHGGIYEALNVTSSATFTVTYNPTGPSNDTDIAIHEYSGIATTSAFDVDQENIDNTSGGTTHTTGTTATTNQNDELCFAMLSAEGQSSAYTGLSSGYTKRQEIITTLNMPLMTADKIVSATGTQNLTASPPAGQPYVGTIATYKAASTATSTPQLMLMEVG